MVLVGVSQTQRIHRGLGLPRVIQGKGTRVSRWSRLSKPKPDAGFGTGAPVGTKAPSFELASYATTTSSTEICSSVERESVRVRAPQPAMTPTTIARTP